MPAGTSVRPASHTWFHPTDAHPLDAQPFLHAPSSMHLANFRHESALLKDTYCTVTSLRAFATHHEVRKPKAVRLLGKLKEVAAGWGRENYRLFALLL